LLPKTPKPHSYLNINVNQLQATLAANSFLLLPGSCRFH